MSGAVGLVVALTLMVGTVTFLGGVMVASIRREVRESRVGVWQDFGLSIALAALFLTSWFGHAISQWQAFVVLAAMLIHRGSAESRDSDDRMEQALQRIEDSLGTTPGPRAALERKKQHD